MHKYRSGSSWTEASEMSACRQSISSEFGIGVVSSTAAAAAAAVAAVAEVSAVTAAPATVAAAWQTVKGGCKGRYGHARFLSLVGTLMIEGRVQGSLDMNPQGAKWGGEAKEKARRNQAWTDALEESERKMQEVEFIAFAHYRNNKNPIPSR